MKPPLKRIIGHVEGFDLLICGHRMPWREKQRLADTKQFRECTECFADDCAAMRAERKRWEARLIGSAPSTLMED